MRVSLDEQLAALATLSLAQLRTRWTDVSDGPVPRVSAALLRLAIAYALQERVHGGLSRRASQRLEQIAVAKTRTTDAQPGMRLVREWQCRLHVVTIAEDGTVNRTYISTTRRVTSGDELKQRNGLGGFTLDLRVIHES